MSMSKSIFKLNAKDFFTANFVKFKRDLVYLEINTVSL